MVALAFGERYPERVSQLLVIGAADRAHPMATAWRSVQRRIVRFAAQERQRRREGLQLARALAMSTYRSTEEFAARFAGPPTQARRRASCSRSRTICSARGADYAARYRPESFLCLSESIDLHRVDAARIFVPDGGGRDPRRSARAARGRAQRWSRGCPRAGCTRSRPSTATMRF